jgi:hypothetical protein
LTVDYAASTPLWADDGAANISDLTPLRLPPTLEAALITWQHQFDSHFAVDRWPHWDNKPAEQWHIAEGHRLFARLVNALPTSEITLSIWAVDADSVDDITGARRSEAGVWLHKPRQQQR